MTADECNARAAQCAANAALAADASVSQGFMRAAAEWRAMAVRDIFLGHLGAPMGALSALNGIPQLPGVSG